MFFSNGELSAASVGDTSGWYSCGVWSLMVAVMFRLNACFVWLCFGMSKWFARELKQTNVIPGTKPKKTKPQNASLIFSKQLLTLEEFVVVQADRARGRGGYGGGCRNCCRCCCGCCLMKQHSCRRSIVKDQRWSIESKLKKPSASEPEWQWTKKHNGNNFNTSELRSKQRMQEKTIFRDDNKETTRLKKTRISKRQKQGRKQNANYNIR
jgi:hypothetical protein